MNRLLLTFDDGPHTNTESVLDVLAKNPVQEGIKAIFFVQTRSAAGGGCRLGRVLLQREHAEGPVLGLHTGTTRGHVSHTSMSLPDLARSLQDGRADLRAITNDEPWLVRPPYWWFNPATMAEYERQGLHMLLSDVKAYDGINWGLRVFARWTFRFQLAVGHRRLARREIPSAGGVAPVIITFHDTNACTAGHLSEYLELLIIEAGRAGLSLDRKPYYDEAPEIVRAALLRAVHPLLVASPGRRQTVA